MADFRKTSLMNILGALGIVILGIALFVNKMDQGVETIVFIVVLYAGLLSVPVGTACALSTTAGTKLRTVMLWANWFFIAVWCISLASTLVHYSLQSLEILFGSALFFVVPEGINIRALRSLVRKTYPAQPESP